MSVVDGAVEAVSNIQKGREAIEAELRKRIVGQSDVIELMLISLFARGHCLFIGVPGLAKTLLISSLAESLALSFKRIQFTPDLMPPDITGTEILQEDHTTGRRDFRFIKGPIFTNILLADEINRTPPKTQAALLQAMQEYEVTAAGRTHVLEQPFQVFATQNPIEQEGTYPLPEAQLDRFMFSVNVSYPSLEDEVQIVRSTTSGIVDTVHAVVTPQDIVRYQNLVLQVPVAEHVVRYAVRLVQASRPNHSTTDPFIQNYVSWGAGPRASQNLIIAGKARALLQGRYAVTAEDVRALAPTVLKHRIIPNFRAQAEQIGSGDIVEHLLKSVSDT